MGEETSAYVFVVGLFGLTGLILVFSIPVINSIIMTPYIETCKSAGLVLHGTDAIAENKFAECFNETSGETRIYRVK